MSVKRISSVVTNNQKAMALLSINNALKDRKHSKATRESYKSMWRSSMQYTQILCSRCYKEINNDICVTGDRHKRYYHIKCATELNIV